MMNSDKLMKMRKRNMKPVRSYPMDLASLLSGSLKVLGIEALPAVSPMGCRKGVACWMKGVAIPGAIAPMLTGMFWSELAIEDVRSEDTDI
jgi:hypothetical protein